MNKKHVQEFANVLGKHKAAIDADIAAYSSQIRASTLSQYGPKACIPTDAFLGLLSRGGKRIRGILTIVGYEMSGGADRQMILAAARAIEMIHAYVLVMDDIQDRSNSRRGGTSVHKQLEQYHHDHQLSGDAKHFGLSIGLNAMGIGNHAAQVIIANLCADAELKIKALSILNRTCIITAYGQTGDIMNEVSGEVSEKEVEDVLEWKTSHYTILNPLHMGMVLAGAGCEATDAITNYALHVGKAFQITDDIVGTFGQEFESGKSPLDDIKEGKRTLLTVKALGLTDAADRDFLISMLGNQNITQLQFSRCKDIIEQSGALQYAKDQSASHVATAKASLREKADLWDSEGVAFLEQLAEYLLTRSS